MVGSPEELKKGNLYHNDFGEEDVAVIKRAWEFISKRGLRARLSFETAGQDITDPRFPTDFKTRPEDVA